MMFELIANKINNAIQIEFEGSYSIAQIDIALKDICIYLKSQQTLKKDNYVNHSSGNLIIAVDKYDRNLSSEEQMLVNMRLLPINNVIIESNGFAFDEIQELMAGFQNQLPAHFKSSFMYSVNFTNLTVD